MAMFSIFNFFIALIFLVFHIKYSTSEPDFSFSYKIFGKDPSFESNIALYGDAKVISGGSRVELTASVSSSAGLAMCKKPIKLIDEGKPRKFASFSTYFSFSMSHGTGDGLAFVILPNGFNAIAFDNSSSDLALGLEKNVSLFAIKYDTLNRSHLGIDVRSHRSVKVKDLASINLVLNNGQKLHSWIDYEASSKRIEIRLSRSGSTKPVDPLVSYSIDLTNMWNDEAALVGLSSSNKNSSQTCSIYSWSFELRHAPNWMHSQPLDPEAFTKNPKPLTTTRKKGTCFLRVLAALILGTTCGALTATCVLYLWTVFGSRRPVVPESAVHPVDFEYKKVKVVVGKSVEDGKS